MLSTAMVLTPVALVIQRQLFYQIHVLRLLARKL